MTRDTAAAVRSERLEERMAALRRALDRKTAPGAAKRSSPDRKAKIAAGTGAAGLALLKSKAVLMAALANGKLLLLGLTKVPTLLSMAVYASWGGGGLGFGAALVACIYVHEIGHVAALKRYGIEASAPIDGALL